MFKWAEKLPDDAKPSSPPPDPRLKMMRWFGFDHLPERLRPISSPFAVLAQMLLETIPAGAEATEAMRKLLEAKDCAVRAFLEGHPTALKEPPPKESTNGSD
jgi:hypothetical protein